LKTVSESSAARVSSIEPLLAMLTVYSPIQLSEIGFKSLFKTCQDYYIQNINKLTSSSIIQITKPLMTVKGSCMHLLGDIVKNIGDEIPKEYQETLFRNFYTQLDRQLLKSGGKESELALISGLLSGLDASLFYDSNALIGKYYELVVDF